MRANINTNSHMLQELGAYFETNRPLHTADLGTLVHLAGYVYNNFLTTSAYENATSLPDDIHPTSSRVDKLLQMALSQLSNSSNSHTSNVPAPLLDDISSDSSSDSSSENETLHRAKHSLLVPELPIGDQALGTMILLLRDSFWYLEFATAVAEGNVGRVMEVIKVCTAFVSEYGPNRN
jgi:hypothetical protein